MEVDIKFDKLELAPAKLSKVQYPFIKAKLGMEEDPQPTFVNDLLKPKL